MKLGKTPAQRDKRNIKLATLLYRALPPVPDQWDFDLDFAKVPIPTPAFANDRLGDCVIAGRAHMTLMVYVHFAVRAQRRKIGFVCIQPGKRRVYVSIERRFNRCGSCTTSGKIESAWF